LPETGAREAAAEHALKNLDADPTTRTARRDTDTLGGEELVRPAHARWTPATPAAPATIDAAPGADPSARIERIAEQILLAAEVRLHGDGAVEARLQLDLGRLGRMNVALERTAEGQIRVALEPTSAEARDLLQARGQDLAHRLEARGLKLQELTVKSSGETVLQIEGGGREATETAASRPAVPASDSIPTEPAAGREPGQRERSDEEHERRDRRQRHEGEPAGEEEEE
jgi:flagellar hook-length control protein FliK